MDLHEEITIIMKFMDVTIKIINKEKKRQSVHIAF